MSKLEAQFFEPNGKTLIAPSDEEAPLINDVLKHGIIKGKFVSRGGMFCNYTFNLDLIYS